MSPFRIPRKTGSLTFVLMSLVLWPALVAASPVEVLSSGPDEIRLRLATGEIAWEQKRLVGAGVSRHLPRLDGFFSDADPFAPVVPAYGTWLVLPPGTRAVVDVVDESWEPLDGREVLLGALPVRRTDAETGRDLLSAEYVLPGEQPRTGVPALSEAEMAKALAGAPAGAPLEIGETASWRGRRVVPVTFRPLQTDDAGRARRLMREGEWRIRFVRDAKAASRPGRAEIRDARFGSMFLNGASLDDLPREAIRPRTAGARVAAKALLAPEVRIPVTRTGLVLLRAGNLANAGLLDGFGVPEEHIRLYQRRYVPDQDPPYDEIEVPVLMLGDGGDFTGDDALLFYGLRVRDDGPFNHDGTDYPDSGDPHETYNPSGIDPVNNGNIYYLAAADPEGGDPWARMEPITLPAAGGVPTDTYRRIDYFEEDTHYGYYPYSNTSDRNFWNAQLGDPPERGLAPVNPFPGAANARLRVGVYGFGSATRSLRVSLVKDEVETILDTFDANFQGVVYDSGEAMAVADLVDADLRVSNAVSAYINGYLDWYELTYDALYQARDDELEFDCGPGAGPRSLEVEGFTNDQILLVDISDPRAPRHVELAAENLMDAGGTTTLAITADQAAPGARRFLALAGDPAPMIGAFPYFKASRVAYPDDPAAVTTPPDVLVITHPTFRAEAERWAQHRRDRSPTPLEIHIVDVHAVFDWYGGGLKNPDAIKRLCRIAQDEWGTWALQIFGDANENVKGLSDTHNLRDWVPSHWHRWYQSGYEYELLPSDKWFVTETDDPEYPYNTSVPAGMVAGRFPGNSTGEITAMVDKVITFETATGDWKRRAVFVADDAWSDGYNISASDQAYSSTEEDFEETQEIAAANWESFADTPPDGVGKDDFTSARVYLSTYLEPLSPPHSELRSRPEFTGYAETHALPVLLAEGGQGAAIFHYQGHANDHLMAHEQIIEDVGNSLFYREDAGSFDNSGRPWILFGLGCHVTSWSRDGSGQSNPTDVPSLGEKFLRRPNASAVATYASSGYEFLSPNAQLVQTQFETMLQTPPRGEVTGETLRSRWVLGEILLASEAAFLALHPNYSTYRRAVAQYTLLGDALMVIDAGPPWAEVLLDGLPLDDGDELAAPDAANELALSVRAFDEAGVDRLTIVDSEGADLSSLAVGGTPDGALSDQRATWDLVLPVPTQDYSVTFKVYDTAAPNDEAPHFALTVKLPVTIELYLDGEPFVFGETEVPLEQDLAFTGRAVTAAFIDAGATLDLQGRNAVVTDESLTRVDAHTIDFACTVNTLGGEVDVVLLIDGLETVIPLLDDAVVVLATGIQDLYAFPNPVSGDTRFLFQTDADPAPGRISLYSVAGHAVGEIAVRASHFVGGGRVIVPWDGRDVQGDDLANGVYLYRVELSAPSGTVTSDMQRLVMMQ
ncbi:hypothetical protein H8E07_08365 [bacterium]|nr:hypothetical protein [bacterium]